MRLGMTAFSTRGFCVPQGFPASGPTNTGWTIMAENRGSVRIAVPRICHRTLGIWPKKRRYIVRRQIFPSHSEELLKTCCATIDCLFGVSQRVVSKRGSIWLTFCVSGAITSPMGTSHECRASFWAEARISPENAVADIAVTIAVACLLSLLTSVI
jgi:hypothetical protein